MNQTSNNCLTCKINLKALERVLFLFLPQNKADVLAKYTKPAILVLDEIGRFLNQQAERQALYYILNARYNKKLNTVLVSNLNPKEFGEYIGNATADRIAEKRVIVELTGVSYRKQ